MLKRCVYYVTECDACKKNAGKSFDSEQAQLQWMRTAGWVMIGHHAFCLSCMRIAAEVYRADRHKGCPTLAIAAAEDPPIEPIGT